MKSEEISRRSFLKALFSLIGSISHPVVLDTRPRTCSTYFPANQR